MSVGPALAELRRGDPALAARLLDDLPRPRTQDWLAARGAVLLAMGDPANAAEALRTAIERAANTAETVLNLALAEGQLRNRERSRALMRMVAAQVPAWSEPWLRLAESFRHDSDVARAITAYEQALTCDPARHEALMGLAALRIQHGDAAGGQALLLRCIGHHPDHAPAWDALGVALTQTGDMAAAESAFGKAQALAPGNYDYALRRVAAAHAAGRGDVELARLTVAAEADPLNATLPTAGSCLLNLMGRLADALDLIEVAVAIAPDAIPPALLRAEMLVQSTRGDDAIRALRHALTLQPDDRRLINNLAAVLMRQHQHADAARLLRELRSRQDDDPTCLCNLANATALLGEQSEAVAIASHAIVIAPDTVLPYRALANVLPYDSSITGTELLRVLRQLSDRLPRKMVGPMVNDRDPDRRLRVGLLSGSLRTHPVGWLTVAGFENLDPLGFELHCLAQKATHDPIARRFRAVAKGWHNVDHLEDAALATLSRSLGIDIMIDLGGYGDAGRMPACAWRLAPVQVKWVGMQNHSTGLREMDWFLTDRWETPEHLTATYSERLLRMPDGYVCYSPPAHAPDVVPPPALRNGHVTFGCFNNLAKITPAVITAWSDILKSAAGSRMILKTHQFSDAETRAAIATRFAANGIDAERVELRGASPHREFLRQYGDVDIVLDPFPYSGGLTTCEALWMGVPTITLAGEIFAARHSCSHLSNVGLTDWVTSGLDAYKAMAIARAGDIDGLCALRSALRDRVRRSPLCDAPRFGRGLGMALRGAWREWCLRPDKEREFNLGAISIR